LITGPGYRLQAQGHFEHTRQFSQNNWQYLFDLPFSIEGSFVSLFNENDPDFNPLLRLVDLKDDGQISYSLRLASMYLTLTLALIKMLK
jgi:hypothetical protein